MIRREFMTLLGGAAAAWPIAARAQTTEKMYRLGALSPATAQLDSVRSIVLPELAKAGIAVGRNLILDARAGSMEQLPGLARDLIASNPDAVMAVSGAAIGALKAASKTVPIVMSMSDYDPVAAGFAESFARPEETSPVSQCSRPCSMPNACSSCMRRCRRPVASPYWQYRKDDTK